MRNLILSHWKYRGTVLCLDTSYIHYNSVKEGLAVKVNKIVPEIGHRQQFHQFKLCRVHLCRF